MNKRRPARTLSDALKHAPRWFRRKNARGTFAFFGIKRHKATLRNQVRDWIERRRLRRAA